MCTDGARSSSVRLPAREDGAIAIDSFPEDMQKVLTDTFDKDGNGIISSEELIEAVHAFRFAKDANKFLRRGLAASGVALLAMIGANAGLTYAIIDANKETQVQGRSLVTLEDEPVSVNTNEIELSLPAIAFLPSETVVKVDDIVFTSEDFETHFYRKALSIDIQPEVGIKVVTTAQDTLEWNINEGSNLNITLKDGTTWAKHIACTRCSAINVFPSTSILDGLQKFEEVTGVTKDEVGGADGHDPRHAHRTLTNFLCF